MVFDTRSARRVTTPAPCGSHFIPDYERRVQDDGTTELVCVGEKNIYAEIQEGCKGLTPYEVLDRYARCPDPSILKEQEKQYADLTSAPRSLAELEQSRINARNAFYSLPVSIRELFGNNYQIFMAHPEQAAEVLRGMSDAGKKEAATAAAVSATASSVAADPVPGTGAPGVTVK